MKGVRIMRIYVKSVTPTNTLSAFKDISISSKYFENIFFKDNTFNMQWFIIHMLFFLIYATFKTMEKHKIMLRVKFWNVYFERHVLKQCYGSEGNSI